MTTSLPTASPELPLAGTPAGTAANPGSLLDLLAAAQPGQPGQPSAVTATAGGVPPESFATLLAPASTPVVPAPAAPLATAHATTHATSARALRLPVVTETVPEAATPVLPAPEGDNPAAPLDRSTLEAALALVATLWPAIAPVPQTPPPAELTLDSGLGRDETISPEGDTPVAAINSGVLAPVRFTLTARDGTPLPLPEKSTPAESSAAPTRAAAPVANPTPSSIPVQNPSQVRTLPAATQAAAPLNPHSSAPVTAPPSAGLQVAPTLQPVAAELEWDNGVKLAAELAPLVRTEAPGQSTAGPTTNTPSQPTSGTARAQEPQARLATAATASAPQPEKNASSAQAELNSAFERGSPAEKNFLNAGNKELTTDNAQAGIGVAQARPAMPAAPQHLSNVAPATSPVPTAAPQVERPATPASTARRAVDTVVEMVHAQVVSRLQPVPSVQLRFKVGHEDLAVRVQLRDGEVRTEFRTDNAELRAAVTQEWRAVTAKSDTALRFLDPVFLTPPSSSTSQGGTNSQHQHQQNAQAQQEQHQHQQFRSQLEMFGSVRRSIPTPIAAELAPVTPLPTATSHRLSAVA